MISQPVPGCLTYVGSLRSPQWPELYSASSSPASCALKNDDVYNLSKLTLPFAFTLEGYYDHVTKDDPRYVKSFARTFRRTDGIDQEQLRPTQECTLEDFDRFPEPT